MGRKERVGATSKGRDWKRRKAKGNTRKGKERETEKEGRGRACPTNEKNRSHALASRVRSKA